MKFLLSCLFVAIVGLSSDGLAVTIFEDGGTSDFAGADPTGAIVRDGPSGDPTTVNLLAGADLGPTDIQDASFLNVFDGTTVDDFDASGSASLEISGGSHGTVDYLDGSSGLISGGSFVSCFPCLRLFANANATVTGGTFSSPNQVVALASGFSTLQIHGGSFTGIVRATDDSRIEIFGGGIERAQSLDQATVVLYGDGFLASEGATIVLDGFGEITDSFNGTITGELSDGSPLAIDALNGVVGSKIVLAPGAPSVPGLSDAARLSLALALLAAGVLFTSARVAEA
ncbi:MAG: hypothetical protein JRF15_08080 [Deltaproteobacteria bacterium]|jgi:hypothetical protein|nr:hypothetical protein [Deltaproteobacteria bacterium]